VTCHLFRRCDVDRVPQGSLAEIQVALQAFWFVKPILTAFGDIVVAVFNLIRDNWDTSADREQGQGRGHVQ
jgi:hypothetical protein